MTYVQRLVGQARETQRDASRWHPRNALEVVDAVGCILRGADHPMVRRAAAQAEPSHGGPFSSLAEGTRDPVERAVLIDSLACHVDEFDSMHPASATVPAAVVVPAALSVAVRLGCSGERLLEAVACGYDVLASVASRFGGPALYDRSWWPTSTFGALGAAAAVGVLLELDDDALANALAISASSVGGLLSDDRFGDGHYLAAAQAAAYGAQAAHRAARGMTASWSLLDGPASRAFDTRAEGQADVASGSVEDCVFKWYPCARPLHSVIEALVELRRDGVDLASLTRIEAVFHPNLMRFVSAKAEVTGPADAAASLVFATCAAVQGRESDPAFFREARATWNGTTPSFHLTPGPAGPFTWESRLTCTTVAGDELEVLGRPNESPDGSRVRDKFLANVASVGLEGPAASALHERLLDLPAARDVGTALAPLLRPDRA